MSENIVSFKPRLRPGEKLRTHPCGAAGKATRYADLLEAALTLHRQCSRESWDEQIAEGLDKQDVDILNEPLIVALDTVRRHLLEPILENFDLVGLELRDERVRLLGVIALVTDPDEDAQEPAEARVIVEPEGTRAWRDFVDGMQDNMRSVNLPGSRLSGDHALIEAVRLRARGIQR
jgi:hypothetical protein